MRQVNIYALSDPRDGAIRYIGQTVDTSNRYREHLGTALYQDTGKASWIFSLLTHGLLPRMRVIQTTGWDNRYVVEKRWMRRCREYGCKLTNGDRTIRIWESPRDISLIGLDTRLALYPVVFNVYSKGDMLRDYLTSK